jgi:hypothetical protein
MHRRNRTLGPEEIGHASVLVSCIACGRLHRAVDPFEFHPVCVACAASRKPQGPSAQRGRGSLLPPRP